MNLTSSSGCIESMSAKSLEIVELKSQVERLQRQLAELADDDIESMKQTLANALAERDSVQRELDKAIAMNNDLQSRVEEQSSDDCSLPSEDVTLAQNDENHKCVDTVSPESDLTVLREHMEAGDGGDASSPLRSQQPLLTLRNLFANDVPFADLFSTFEDQPGAFCTDEACIEARKYQEKTYRAFLVQNNLQLAKAWSVSFLP